MKSLRILSKERRMSSIKQFLLRLFKSWKMKHSSKKITYGFCEEQSLFDKEVLKDSGR